MIKTIHIVEDNKDFAREIALYLKDEGFNTIVSESILQVKQKVESIQSDLYIVDIGLPDGTGFLLCETLRENYTGPILMLTALDSEEDIIRGLQCGADDYVTKPCSLRVLLSRIKALMRRNQWNKEKMEYLVSGDLKFDLIHQTIFDINGRSLNLGKTEFELAVALMHSYGQIMPRNLLLEKIWDEKERFIEDNTLSVHVSRLRNKLGQYNGKAYIETVKSIGYRWNVEVKR